MQRNRLKGVDREVRIPEMEVLVEQSAEQISRLEGAVESATARHLNLKSSSAPRGDVDAAWEALDEFMRDLRTARANDEALKAERTRPGLPIVTEDDHQASAASARKRFARNQRRTVMDPELLAAEKKGRVTTAAKKLKAASTAKKRSDTAAKEQLNG